MADESIMQLRIQLTDVHPPVWRRILVPTTIRYDQLNIIIQLAFGWTNSHLHSFVVDHYHSIQYLPEGGKDYFSNTRFTNEYLIYPDLKLGSVTYTYDFGDNWEHKIKLEKMLSVDELPSSQLPYCIGGRGATRMEDTRIGDSYNGEANMPFDKEVLNELLDEYVTAGEMLLEYDGQLLGDSLFPWKQFYPAVCGRCDKYKK